MGMREYQIGDEVFVWPDDEHSEAARGKVLGKLTSYSGTTYEVLTREGTMIFCRSGMPPKRPPKGMRLIKLYVPYHPESEEGDIERAG